MIQWVDCRPPLIPLRSGSTERWIATHSVQPPEGQWQCPVKLSLPWVDQPDIAAATNFPQGQHGRPTRCRPTRWVYRVSDTTTSVTAATAEWQSDLQTQIGPAQHRLILLITDNDCRWPAGEPTRQWPSHRQAHREVGGSHQPSRSALLTSQQRTHSRHRYRRWQRHRSPSKWPLTTASISTGGPHTTWPFYQLSDIPPTGW